METLFQGLSSDQGAGQGFLKELERLTDPSIWKGSKIDVALCHEMFNAIDEVLECLINHLISG